MRRKDKNYCIYVDTGGTHSHCIIVDEKGKIARGHAATIPDNLVECFFESIDVAAKEWGKTAAEILPECQVIGYGTTQGTNHRKNNDRGKLAGSRAGQESAQGAQPAERGLHPADHRKIQ